MFSIKPKTLHCWYKENLTGYKQDIEAKRWGEKKITVVDKTTGEVLKKKTCTHCQTRELRQPYDY